MMDAFFNETMTDFIALSHEFLGNSSGDVQGGYLNNMQHLSNMPTKN